MQTVTISGLAQFANAVYLSTSSIPSGWTLLKSSFIQQDGFWAEAWQNSSTKEIVIGYRGTVPSIYQTLEQDAYVAAGTLAPGAIDAATFAKQVATIANGIPGGGYTVAITGHSLGGYEAQDALVALQGNESFAALNPYSVVFDAPGLPSSALGGAAASSFNSINFYGQGGPLDFTSKSHGRICLIS